MIVTIYKKSFASNKQNMIRREIVQLFNLVTNKILIAIYITKKKKKKQVLVV